MPIQHLKRDTPADDVVAVLRRDGCAIIDALAEPGQLDRVADEMAPYLEATSLGTDAFTGDHTRRTGGLVARSAAAREIVGHQKVLDVTKGVLEKATNFHLHLTQIIAIGPGESAQAIHRDQWAFDFFPFPKGYEVQCNTIWAMTDFTEANGATRAIPGSNRVRGSGCGSSRRTPSPPRWRRAPASSTRARSTTVAAPTAATRCAWA